MVLALRKGADPNFSEGKDGWTAIHYAARWGDIAMIKALIYFGANINVLNKDKESPLHVAAMWNRRDVTIYLMMKDAHTWYVNHDGVKAVDCASDPEIRNLMINWDEFKMKNSIDITALGKIKKYHYIS